MITSLTFVLMFSIFTLLIGPGISLLNSISPLGIARDHLIPGYYYTKKHAPDNHKMPNYDEVNALVTLFAAFNTAGRLAFGLCADKFKHKIETVSWLVPIASLMTIAQFSLAYSDSDMLYIGVCAAGVAYGGVFCILPILVSQVFGMV